MNRNARTTRREWKTAQRDEKQDIVHRTENTVSDGRKCGELVIAVSASAVGMSDVPRSIKESPLLLLLLLLSLKRNRRLEDSRVWVRECARPHDQNLDQHTLVREPGGHSVQPPLPPPPPPPSPGTFHYGPKMYLRVSRTQSHLFPGQPLGCTGVIALCARVPSCLQSVAA